MARADTYDYIVIGAGSAGCVLANRLSADPDVSVLLIEAGAKDRHPLVRLPMLMGKLMHSGIYNWRFDTEPEPELDNRRIYWPRGKALGGSSTINGMIYVRGNAADYDRWAQMGNPGWSYAEVLPYFRKSETHAQRRDDFHGGDGPLSVTRARGRNPLFDRFVAAGVEAGYERNDDFNGASQDGFGRYDFTIRNGKRHSTSRAFLRPVMRRPNLTVVTQALTERIVVDNGRAVAGGYARGAAVVIVSDGLERGETDALADAVAKLSRRAWRLSWLTPLATGPGFRPQTEALIAVERFVDDLVDGGSSASIAAHILALGRRRAA